ncbi:hypothetical protein T459_19510 [Capsicum annuum]|uniref:RDRP C-terminal head domain-containing protein n=1 Tax=Capsicum annuum TaxID=4072 RepID=A0A2G2Z1W9_CAPAN|nr:hypothetical protein T459_19510 [Capsicum annuum]
MVGASANWYALMDKLLILRKSNTTENEEMKSMKENLLELIDLYYDAIDASKSGNKLLYEAPDIEKITRRKLDKLTDALVIYRVTYDYTKAIGDVRKCGFSWKVTGSTLCRLHTELDAKTYPNSHVHVTFCIAQIIELEVQRSV